MFAPNLPRDAPLFRGEKGKDDMPSWLSRAKVWFTVNTLQCKGSISDEELARLFCTLAFPDGTPAHH